LPWTSALPWRRVEGIDEGTGAGQLPSEACTAASPLDDGDSDRVESLERCATIDRAVRPCLSKMLRQSLIVPPGDCATMAMPW